MALKIRLARGGAKKRPHYRIVVADIRTPRDGRFIERLGTYDPLLPKDSPDRVQLKVERIKYWLGNGAVPTDRVANFLGKAEIIPMPASRNNPNKGKPNPKTLERMKAKEEAASAAASSAEENVADGTSTDAAAEETTLANEQPVQKVANKTDQPESLPAGDSDEVVSQETSDPEPEDNASSKN